MNTLPASRGLRRPAAAVGLLLWVLAAPASAQATAHFQGQCVWNASHSQFTCNFDAQRPASSPSACPGSFVWRYQWDFGDGTGQLGASPLVAHAYPNGDDRIVGLTVLCWNGQMPTRTRHVCVRYATPGCLRVDGTWN